MAHRTELFHQSLQTSEILFSLTDCKTQSFLSIDDIDHRKKQRKMCSEICPPPRMSFSSDLAQPDKGSLQSMVLESDSSPSSDFEFNVTTSFDYESSSADELFADGMILPIFNRIRHKGDPFFLPKRSSLPPPPWLPCSSTMSAAASEAPGSVLDPEVKPGSKSFWGFKRSQSLNSNSTNKKSFFSSLPPLLSRSNSTGSTPKRTLQKQISIKTGKSNSLSSSSSLSGWNQKPPLAKKSHGNGAFRVSPVLNVPSPTNLFGFGSLFCNNGKDKKKIRR